MPDKLGRWGVVATLFLGGIPLVKCDLVQPVVGYAAIAIAVILAFWFQAAPSRSEDGPYVERGIRLDQENLALTGQPDLKYRLSIAFSTKKRVDLGFKLVCTGPILDREVKAKTISIQERSGEPPDYLTDKTNSMFIAVRNSPSSRCIQIEADLFSSGPIRIASITTLQPGEVYDMKRKLRNRLDH